MTDATDTAQDLGGLIERLEEAQKRARAAAHMIKQAMRVEPEELHKPLDAALRAQEQSR